MKRRQKTKLSFFEAVYVWMYIYKLKWKIKHRGNFESSVTSNLWVIQMCNVVVTYYIALKIFPMVGKLKFKQDGHWGYGALVMGGILVVLIIFDTLCIEKRLDDIMEIHNAQAQCQKDRDKILTWIYVAGSIVLLIAMIVIKLCWDK